MAGCARRHCAWFSALAVAVGLFGCGGGGADDSKGPAQEATFAVGSRSEMLVDRSRPTNATADSEARPQRTFETLVTYPAAGSPGRPPSSGAPASPGGPFPLVVFSHGSGVSTPARFWVHQVGPDFVLGVARDELDVQQVQLLPLQR